MKKLILLKLMNLWFLLISCVFSYAQSINWENYLSSINVTDFIWNDQFIWVASRGGGLVKIDTLSGSSVYFNKNNSGLPTVFLSSLAVDPYGNFWIGTDDGKSGLICLTPQNQWNVYTVQNSQLPDNVVTSIKIDQDGILWIGTLQGILSIDGNIWTTFNNSFFTCVTDLIEDSSGNIWAACYGNGLARFSAGSWSYFNPANTSVNALAQVRDLCADTAGNIYALCTKIPGSSAGSGMCIARYDGSNWYADSTLLNTPGLLCLPYMTMTSFEFDKSDNLWFSRLFNDTSNVFSYPCDAGGYYNWDTVEYFHLPFSGFDDFTYDIRKIKRDQKGRMWYGGYGGLACKPDYNSSWIDFSDKLIVSISAPGIVSMDFDTVKKQIWAGTGNAFQCPDMPFSQYPLSLPQSFPKYGKGICNFDGNQWNSFSSQNSSLPIYQNFMNDIAFDPQGNAWFPSACASLVSSLQSMCTPHLIRSDGNQFILHSYFTAPILGLQEFTSVCSDAGGNIWAGNYNRKLFKYDGISWQLMFNLYQGTDWLTNLYIGSSGDIWAGSWEELSHIVNGNVTNYGHLLDSLINASLPNTPTTLCYVQDIISDDHYVWIASQFGLFRIDNSLNFSFFTLANTGMPENNITALAIDSLQNLWIGTCSKGVAVWLSNGTWAYFNTDNSGLTDDHITSITIDNEEKIWIGTALGGISVMLNNTVVNINESTNTSSECSLVCIPNPVRQHAEIRFSLPLPGKYNIDIYNSLGQIVRCLAGVVAAGGIHSLTWDVKTDDKKEVPAGIYHCVLRSGSAMAVKKIIICR